MSGGGICMNGEHGDLSGGGRNEWRRWIYERGRNELRGQKRYIKKGYK